MSNSPYLPPHVKDYMKQYGIEEKIGDAVDLVLKDQKEDPYSFLMTHFGNLAQQTITVSSIYASQILNSESMPTLQLNFITKYKGEELRLKSQVHFNQSNENQIILYDGDQQQFLGKGIQQAIELVDQQLSNIISNKNIKDQKQIDEILLKYLGENKQQINLVQPISFSLSDISSQIVDKQLFQQYQMDFDFKPKQLPKLFINMLQGSKLVGSKCKVFRYLLIINEQDDPFLAVQMTQSVTANIRKAIISGKQGEAALKFHQDGTILCTADTITDNLKILEAAIDSASLKDKVNIGLVWMADLFYNPELKKYELENPKQPLDTDQLIDFYMKLCTERPCIQKFLLGSDQLFRRSNIIRGYYRMAKNYGNQLLNIKIKIKFQDHRVKIGSRKLYSTLELAKKNTEQASKESHPSLTENEILQRNGQRIQIHYVFLKPYESPTYSQFTQLAKYISNKKPQTNLIFGDNLTDTTDTSLVDLAVISLQVLKFSVRNTSLCISAPLKFEKLIKLSRYIEISQQIKR